MYFRQELYDNLEGYDGWDESKRREMREIHQLACRFFAIGENILMSPVRGLIVGHK
jgi:hypothetical protein